MIVSCLNVVDPFRVAGSSAKCIYFLGSTSLKLVTSQDERRLNFYLASFCLFVHRRLEPQVSRPMVPVVLAGTLCLVVMCLAEWCPLWQMLQRQAQLPGEQVQTPRLALLGLR
jgi:hypothetical protein